MIPKKGDTIFDKRTGEPVTVRGTRKLTGYHAGQVRVYLTGRKDWEAFDVAPDGTFPHYGDYTQTQTAELASKWAETLAQREREQAEWLAQHERYKANISKYAAEYDAPPTFGPIVVRFERTEWEEWGTLRQELRAIRPDKNGEPMLYTDDFCVTVSSTSGRSLLDDMHNRPPLGVNWSACGTQNTDTARAYAALIIAACDEADRRNAATLTTTEEPAHV